MFCNSLTYRRNKKNKRSILVNFSNSRSSIYER